MEVAGANSAVDEAMKVIIIVIGMIKMAVWKPHDLVTCEIVYG